MPDDDAATVPSPAPIPGPTPTGYQRTQGGGVKWLPPSTEQLSRLLPQYDIECLLGRGGMGAVYKGTQKSLKRAVAIKILPPEVDDEDASYTERFKNEAQILARLSHPGIVAVHDFGETSEGQLYIVMEFIDGSDVAQMIAAQGHLPPEHALAVLAHVCDALGYAHKNGVVHRDIKPANILINRDGAVKVADFGLAKLDEPGTTGLTKTGMAMGTPDYVAPEALVMGVQVDGRADLYALGVMLYHMLTGQVPRGAFDMPSKRLGTDPRFDAIIQKAMQMDRDSRYQSSAEIRRDLDVILTMPLVQAGGQSSAAIPKQSLPQKPVAKGPQGGAGTPARNTQEKADKSVRAPLPPATSKAPLFIGLGVAAAIAVGAFMMFGGRADGPPSAVPATQTALGGPSAPPSAPAKVIEKPKPAPVVVSSAPKPETPKPVPEKKADTKPVAAAPAASKSSAPASPAISNLKSSISNAATAAFPPGQWVKLFTKFEDLPEELRKPDSGMTFEDGWIRFESGKGHRIYVVDSLSNYAIRATMQRRGKEYQSKYLLIRAAPKGGYDGYSLALGDGTLDAGRKGDGNVSDYLWKASASQVHLPRVGEEYTLEFGCVGNKLIGRLGKDFVKVITDTKRGSGPGYFTGGEPIRDIEVINLDGIPEAEALRILGVDEKGNDLRALAAKQEQQKAEQAKVVDAASAIPELKALHEQFVKLQAERVTAPFEADVAKLNSGYLGGLDRKMAEEKAAGHLDSVLAIEAEKKLITDQQPIPSAEDDATSTTTPAVLKGLRQIYRDAYAKIEATRAANLKALTDPLTTRLKTLESDLTKKDRIADAKTVKEYREGLASRSGGFQPPSPSPSGSAPPAPTPAVGNTPLLATALKDGFTNSLGMKFVKVPGTDVVMCIHETRYKDYAAYAAEAPGVDAAWMDQSADGFPPTDKVEEHPVIKVNWEDAQKFCAWLSEKEGKKFRLPTDEEWSLAVGLGRFEKRPKGTTPALLKSKETTQFPWVGDFPPKTKDQAGNYSDESRKAKAPRANAEYLVGYDDGFPTTAPVMSFKPNKLGLYDLGGNVWEWCEDWYDDTQQERTLRGQCWNAAGRDNLISSARAHYPPVTRGILYGFRIVVDLKAPVAKPTASPPAPTTAAKSDFSNSLGMKFVKVPGTKVLFCIHETRRQDYAAYAAEMPGVNGLWKNAQKDGVPSGDKDDHPVVSVSWDNAQSFSTWLSEKEGRKYRLPTDQEWSFAVGIGRDEKWSKTTTPDSLSDQMFNEFPWGGDFPPKTKDKAGNFGDMTLHESFPTLPFINGYTDGYATTAPVMSFDPNKLGIYDLGGNVTEWCDDWSDSQQTRRVLRGCSWQDTERSHLLSSHRRSNLADNNTGTGIGFRIVVEMTAP